MSYFSPSGQMVEMTFEMCPAGSVGRSAVSVNRKMSENGMRMGKTFHEHDGKKSHS
jgi:hypothetical protein